MLYDYIERRYGKRFEPGMRVVLTELKHRSGVVLRPGEDWHYVRVRFDDGHEGNCHPDSLKIKE